MKNKVTKEEYQKINERLAFIEEERETLETISQQGSYQAHITLCASFAELIINLQRENTNINQKINTIKKDFLKDFSENSKLYHMLEDKLDEIICSFSLERPTYNIDEQETATIGNYYPSFLDCIEQIQELATKRNANFFLLTYIKNLDEEQDLLLGKKFQYEKSKKAEATKKKIILYGKGGLEKVKKKLKHQSSSNNQQSTKND